MGSGASERRSGSAAALLLMAVAVVLGGAAWYWLSRPQAPQETSTASRTVEAEGSTTAASNVELSGGDAGAEGPHTIGRVNAGPVGDYALMERDFNGTGRIWGEVRTLAGVPYPETWTLTIEPSKVGEGREHAVTRTIESEPGQRDFEFRDLPLGAYLIRAEAEGLTSRPFEISIYGLAGTGAGLRQVNAVIRLHPIAWVDGSIRTADGGVGDDLPVYLVDRRDRTGPRLETRTNTAGTFRFDKVKTGDWLLQVGDAVRPLVGSVPVVVGMESIRLDEIVLPPLTTLEVIVVDEYGRPFPDVDLVGYLRGAGAGAFRVKSDAVGRASVRYLAPGPWRVEAKYELEGQTGKVDLVLAVADEAKVHEVHIR